MSLVLTGPTGSGKSQLALVMAERLGAEIISMDSMALYQGMDIGTAKPELSARARVVHHLIDALEPWQSASVAWWLEQAERCKHDIEQRGKRVLFVGGTPLYLKALLYGLFDGPSADLRLRLRLEQHADQHGPHSVHAQLATVDPIMAQRLHVNDIRRVIRALEVWELTGRPMSAWQTQWAEERNKRCRKPEAMSAIHAAVETADVEKLTHSLDSPRDGLATLILTVPRSQLYATIDARVQAMVAAGWVDEVRALRRLSRPLSREAAQAVGYREFGDYLDARLTLDEAIEQTQRRSRHLAKRQLNWFRNCSLGEPISKELTFAAWGLRIG